MSNTSNEKAEKGSKFWMQKIVNETVYAKKFEEIFGAKLIFLSPLKIESYKEYQLKESKIFSNALGLTKSEFETNFSFWANNQPHWDAIATSNDEKILYLFEAKAHLKELNSKISTTNKNIIEKITNSMQKVFEKISDGTTADFKNWTEKYYQLGNRFTFLYNMNQMHFPKIQRTILILLNIIDDETYISTSQEEWQQHYEKIFLEMTGKNYPPENVNIIYFDGKLT